MADGRGGLEWGQTALLATLTVNMHKDPKKGRPAKVSDFNPYMKSGRKNMAIVIDDSNVGMLRDAFEGRYGKPRSN